MLVNGRGCSFSHKSIAANRNGAAAMLIYEDEQLTSSYGGQSPSYVPSATISTDVMDAIRNDGRTLWIDHLRIPMRIQWVHRSVAPNGELFSLLI